MPRGPKGEKRPADVIGNAVHVMRVAMGEIEDVPSKAPSDQIQTETLPLRAKRRHRSAGTRAFFDLAESEGIPLGCKL